MGSPYTNGDDSVKFLLDNLVHHRPENATKLEPVPSLILEDVGKPVEEFRVYTIASKWGEKVKQTYLNQHTNQTVEFVKDRRDKWLKFDKCKMTIMEALNMLNSFVDESDPDVHVPNIYHAFQTAERIRADHPKLDWFHLTGLIHDVGKVLGMFGEPQWSTTGDTYPVGCAFSDNIVYREDTFNNNPDLYHPIYSTKNGMYQAGCGLRKVLMTWGHDEYMYQVLVHNNTTLPQEALYMIRFHSFYPWHTSGDYMHLCDEHDKKMLPWILEFNKYDLYSKSDETPNVEALVPYYQSLIDKYIPGVLDW